MSSEAKTVWEGKHLRVRTCGRWEFVERAKATGGVVIVAVTDDQKLLLVEQYRVPMGRPVIELPAGLAGDVEGSETEELIQAAKRELFEETGYEAREMNFLMAGPSSAGLTNEVNTMFRATGLRCVGRGGGDEQEQIHLHTIPLVEVHGWLKQKMEQGLGVDPKVYAGLYFIEKEFSSSFANVRQQRSEGN
jgi:ADP-ribose pyrophosphatase